ncbi:MAG: isoprenyl transferase [Syntrophomonadaceae bacterium]
MAKQKSWTADQLDPGRMPRHVAIIMDGNGRWAQKKLLPRTMGHRAGMAALKKVVEACDELHIPYLSVFAFSTENWKRPITEVEYLMNLLVEFLHKELQELHDHNVQINIIGDYTVIPRQCQVEIDRALEMTRNNTGLVFTIALNYGSRREIIDAVKCVAEKIQAGQLEALQIDEASFSAMLYTRNLPDPDLLIRTAGEMRISNFMLWQIAYSEIAVTQTLWPDFTREDLIKSLLDYQNRERRYGGLSK